VVGPALHHVLAGSCMLQLSIYTCLEPLLPMLFQVLGLWFLVHLKLFLGLAVTEININFEINIKKQEIKKRQKLCKQGRDDA